MDSGNSGSISSSGDEEYDSSRPHDQTLLPPTFLNHHTQFGSISSHPQPSLVSSSHHHHHQTLNHHHPSLFDLSSSYLHSLSQSQPNSNPNSVLNLDTGTSRSAPNCTDPQSLQGVSPSSSTPAGVNQCLLAPHQGLAADPSLQLRSVHDDNARVLSPPTNNAVRNSKKRTRASRRAPTTVLTTDTSNFRAMVQEFTGIPAPPFSGSSYSRRLDLLTGSSSFRSSASHLDAAGSSFYPLRPSPQKPLHPNPLFIPSASSSSPSPSILLHNNMVDAMASTTNVSSSAATNNNTSSNNSVNYQLPPDLGLPYHQPQSIMLSMQNHSIFAFHPPPPLHLPSGFSAKSQIPISFEDLGMSHGQVNAHLVAGGVPAGHHHHGHVTSEGMPLRNASDDGCRDGGAEGGGGRRDPVRSFDGVYGKVGSAGSCKLNFSAAVSSGLNHEKALENTSTRGGEGAVDSWICSSD